MSGIARAEFEQQAAELAALRATGMTLRDASAQLGLTLSSGARRMAWLRTRGPVPGVSPAPPAAMVWRWQDAAACREAGGDLFFGSEGERRWEKDIREQQAKALCSGCPVREECLEYALTRKQEAGVWGGLGEEERAAYRDRWMREGRKARAVA